MDSATQNFSVFGEFRGWQSGKKTLRLPGGWLLFARDVRDT